MTLKRNWTDKGTTARFQANANQIKRKSGFVFC